MKNKIQGFIIVFVLLVSNTSFAATLEVGPGQTYSTIKSAVTASVNGDVINIHAGTYNENITVNKSVTLQANSGDNPVIDPVATGSALNINSDDVVIDGLTIVGWTGFYSSGINIDNQDNVIIQNTTIYNGPTNAYGIKFRNSTRATIKNNTIYNSTKGIAIVSGRSTDGTYANGTVISNNSIFDNNTDGIDIHGEYITINDNSIYNNLDTDWAAKHPDGIQIIASTVDGYSSGKHIKIYSNLIKNHTQNIFLEGRLGQYYAEDIHVYNNVIYNDSAVINGVNMDTINVNSLTLRNTKDIYIYNNTFGRASSHCLYSMDGADGTLHIKNNIFANDLKMAIYIMDPMDISDNEMDHNQYYITNYSYITRMGSVWYSTLVAFASANTQEANGKSGDPKLAPFPAPAPLPTSPVIDAGASLSTAYNAGKNSNSRIQGVWDIGAYEVKVPSKPSNLR